MKATKLVERLQELIDEHGDKEVFSEADWEWVREVEYDPKLRKEVGYTGDNVDVFVLTG